MSTAQLLAFDAERAAARVQGEAKRKAFAAIPEISAEDILKSFQRELRSVAIEGFGAVYFYYPLNITEQFAVHEKIGDDGRMTAPAMVRSLILLARNSDGSLKFKDEHFDALMNAPASAIVAFAKAAIHTYSISEASVEKKS